MCSEQKLVSWLPYRAVFGFLIPLLIGVLQLDNKLCRWLYQMIMKFVSKLPASWNRFKGSDNLVEQPRFAGVET
ncbi:hypothetical protein EZV62_009626 [Acer yangbiense]|uniref:Uncharacterized protein n=1 Tax=Acer yangbiense TaxID=1000413 RepID=A0A5C7I2I8_9ROSI|nr:hypothetical protein EZV62_009626 [Acer yangbiense]